MFPFPIDSDFLDVVCDILPTLREMTDVWVINDARIPGLVLPEDMVPMDITTVSGESFENTHMTSPSEPSWFIFTSGTTGMNLFGYPRQLDPLSKCPFNMRRRLWNLLTIIYINTKLAQLPKLRVWAEKLIGWLWCHGWIWPKCGFFLNIVSPAVHTLLPSELQRLDSLGNDYWEALILILDKVLNCR